MTTDRTQPARPVAPHDRPAAASGRRDTGNAFAALLDAHAAPERSDAPRRDDVRRVPATAAVFRAGVTPAAGAAPSTTVSSSPNVHGIV